MSTYTYTAQISDFSGAPPVAGAALRVRVRPEQEASGPDGQLLGSDIPVTVTGATATFTLVATPDTYPTTRYVLIVDWVTHNRAGQTISFGASRFGFTAVAGGGDIRTMSGAPESAVFFTPNWPSPRIPGVYVDLETGTVYRKDI